MFVYRYKSNLIKIENRLCKKRLIKNSDVVDYDIVSEISGETEEAKEQFLQAENDLAWYDEI